MTYTAFQLRLSESKPEKLNTNAKGLLGIANKLINKHQWLQAYSSYKI